MTKEHPSKEMIQGKQPFTRDRLTWLAYGMLAYFAYLEASLGSVLPFIRAELHLDYALVAWHFSVFGAGMIVAGLTADQLIRRFGRANAFWGGGIGMAFGSLLLILGQQPWMTLLGALIMGLPGTLLLVTIQSILADRHREQQGIALTEANLGASIGAGLSALCVGGLAQLGLGWRGGLIVPILALVALAVVGKRERVNSKLLNNEETVAPGEQRQEVRRPLSFIFWVNWLAVVLLVSVEWCMTYWAASFLQSKLHIDAGSAATLLAFYLLSTIGGRLIGSRLTRVVTGPLLLFIAIGVTLLGFLSFWLATAPLLVIGGLLFAGIGSANLWPQSIAQAFAIAPKQADQASASVSFAAGIAICAAPLLLGTLANITSLSIAYGIVPFLLLLALVVSVIATSMGNAKKASKTSEVTQKLMKKTGIMV